MNARRTAVATTGLLILAACGTSPQVNFHALSVSPGIRRALSPEFRSVQVAAVHMPPSLERREIVTQTGPHTVDISSRDRWSEPLGAMARQVLSQDLQARLSKDTVVMPDMPTTSDTAQIVVSILQFGPEASGKAVLVGSWSLSSGKTDEVLFRRNVSLRSDLGGPGANAAAAAMSDLLGQLATDIAAKLEGED